MKKAYLYLTLVAFASFSLASCDNEDEKNAINEDSGIVGTWEGDADEYHYPIAVINADGTYEWEWAGIARFKDVGKYTYEGNKIVMTATNYYEWDQDKGKYVTNEYIEGNPKRNIKILELSPGLMSIELNDYFMGGGQGEGFPFVLYRKGYVQNIQSKDLEGTWESYYEDGSLSERIILSGNSYTAYDVWEMDSTLSVEKSTGTWSIQNSVMTVKPTAVMFSYERVNNDYVYYPVDPETLETENWVSASWTRDEYTQKIYLAEDKKTLYVAGIVFKKK